MKAVAILIASALATVSLHANADERSDRAQAAAERVLSADQVRVAREIVVAKEKAEAHDLAVQGLQRTQGPGGVADGGAYWLQGLSDANLDNAVAIEQKREDRLAYLIGDLGIVVPSMPPPPPGYNPAKRLAELVVKEKACRAAPRCVADRLAQQKLKELTEDMCSRLGTIQEMQEEIRTERANPSGVVNLKTLHDDGDTIQRYEYDLAPLKAEYTKIAHKQFSAASCR